MSANDKLPGSKNPALSIQWPSRKTLLFIGLSLLWYSCSFLAASTSKALLSGKKIKGITSTNSTLNTTSTSNSTTSMPASHLLRPLKVPPLFPYPVVLTAVQFLFVFTFSFTLSSPTIASYIYGWMGKPTPRDSISGRRKGLMSTLVMVNGAKLREMAGLSVFTVAGHAMTSSAILMVPVSTVHTVKALSPLFTVLSYVFILHLSYPLRTYVSLAPLTLGVILACSGISSIEGPKAWLGILLSVGSTVAFVAQNLWSKKLLGHALSGATPVSDGSSNVKLDKLNILFWSSGVSVILTLPLLLYSDLPRWWSSRSFANEVSGQFDFAGNHSTIASITKEASVASMPITASYHWKIIRLLVSNGIVHFTQALLAFNILGLTSPVTYSIASLFKRVFVICFAIVWFGQTVTGVQWTGIILTFIGLYLYNDSKQKPSSGGSSSFKGESTFGLRQTMAGQEDEAVHDIGVETGSRRRAGILPLFAAPANDGGTTVGNGSAGPIWKGMSSSLTSAKGNANHQEQFHLPSSAPIPDVKYGPKRD